MKVITIRVRKSDLDKKAAIFWERNFPSKLSELFGIQIGLSGRSHPIYDTLIPLGGIQIDFRDTEVSLEQALEKLARLPVAYWAFFNVVLVICCDGQKDLLAAD